MVVWILNGENPRKPPRQTECEQENTYEENAYTLKVGSNGRVAKISSDDPQTLHFLHQIIRKGKGKAVP